MAATMQVEDPRGRFDHILVGTQEAAHTAVNKVWGITKSIWDRLPLVVKWMVGGIVGIGFCYGYGYFVAYVTMAALLAMGMSFGWAYGIAMSITLGSFYGLLMWVLTSRSWD